MNSQESQISSLSGNKRQKVTNKDFGAKMQAKTEVYHFVGTEVGAFLPHYDVVTIWHLRDLITKKRKRIQDKDAKHIHVPQYEDLKIEEFFKWAVEWEIRNNKPGHIMDCFPLVEAERMKFPRQYIADIIYTLAPEDFKQWVSGLTNRRHSKFK